MQRTVRPLQRQSFLWALFPRYARASSTLQHLKDASVAHHRPHYGRQVARPRPHDPAARDRTHHDEEGAQDGVEAEDVVPWLARQPLHRLSLADLVKHGRPPLSTEALFSSARFTLSLLPIRLAHRIQALRNLPYIVVANPNISKIYNNYQHSLSTLLPWQGRTISNLDDEIRFTEVLAELVQTHTDTIPILARGFIESRKYISPREVTRFLDEHLRARIGTRLVAEQHIALHFSSAAHFDPTASPTPCPEHPSYIGVVDSALRPASIIDSCAGFVADVCELNYGVRPRWIIDGEVDTTFAYVPMHLEYIVTELLKNAFRATVENGMGKEPVLITIAPEPPSASPTTGTLSGTSQSANSGQGSGAVRVAVSEESRGQFSRDTVAPIDDNAPGVTIRIRDRGGGISPSVLPHIWSYSFTTFGDDDSYIGSTSGGPASSPSGGGQGGNDSHGWNDDALSVISAASSGGSSIAGLGYGLPLSRAYASYFGGDITVQSLWGWGTDVYLRLKGVARVEYRHPKSTGKEGVKKEENDDDIKDSQES